MRLVFLGVLFLAQLSYANTNDYDRQQIQNRISPVGKVRLQETQENSGKTVSQVAPQPTNAKMTGQEIYEKYCQTCHKDGVAGAPKLQVVADWKPRLDKKNIQGLVQTAIKGQNAMPPKGTCAECSEQDIQATVEYMVPKS